MFPKIPITDILSITFGLLFACWPLVALSALDGRSRHILSNILTLWVILAAVRAYLLFFPSSIAPSSLFPFFIPEPLNTVVFFVAGAVLLTIWRAVQLRNR
jgi:uncharacterized membrane protein YozB (DUF420 family)